MPALVVGLGGIWTEILDDVAIVPLPADPERVEVALRGLRGASMLTGGRGGEPVDLAVIAEAGARVGELLLAEGLELIELNPLIAGLAAASPSTPWRGALGFHRSFIAHVASTRKTKD